jgi:hypothetical protein
MKSFSRGRSESYSVLDPMIAIVEVYILGWGYDWFRSFWD